MNSLVHLFEQAQKAPSDNFTISEKEYLTWHQDFLFETLQYDLRYGQSFCNKFDIVDYILYYMSNVEQADRRIRKYYVQ